MCRTPDAEAARIRALESLLTQNCISIPSTQGPSHVMDSNRPERSALLPQPAPPDTAPSGGSGSPVTTIDTRSDSVAPSAQRQVHFEPSMMSENSESAMDTLGLSDFQTLEVPTYPNQSATSAATSFNNMATSAHDTTQSVHHVVPFDEHTDSRGSGSLMISSSGRSKYLGGTAGSEWLKNVSPRPIAQRRYANARAATSFSPRISCATFTSAISSNGRHAATGYPIVTPAEHSSRSVSLQRCISGHHIGESGCRVAAKG